jgi:hypothetical protein
VHISKVHTVSVLQASDDFRPVLDFQVCLHDFYVHDLALGRAVALGAKAVKLKVSVVRKDKTGDGIIHEWESSLLMWIYENRLKTLSARLMQLSLIP